MKILNQLGIILGICVVGIWIASLLPFSFPGSVIAMIIMVILLMVKVLKEDDISLVSDYLLNNMAFVFVPSGVALIEYFDLLKDVVLQIVFICIISFILVFIVAGYSVSFTLKIFDKKHKEEHL